MKKAIVFLVLFLFSACNAFTRKVYFKQHFYFIEDSEFGAAFIENNGIHYYIDEEIYGFRNQFYAKISGAQDKGLRWVFISEDGYVIEADSAKIDFSNYKKYSKKKLLE